jgi:alkaline phosphatase D
MANGREEIAAPMTHPNPTRRQAALQVGAGALTLSAPGWAAAQDEKPLQRIAFGSCARQNKPQPIWDHVLAATPDLFVFLGDNVYGDTDDPAELQAKYAMLASKPGFQKLRAAVPIRAIWDDHDYGRNDSGRENPMKDASRAIFCDFFGEPEGSPRRTQEGGIYGAWVFGPPGQRVQLILPDLRWNRTPVKSRFGYVGLAGAYIAGAVLPKAGFGGSYRPQRGPGAELLGPAQWAWLEAQFQVPADLRVIGSSLQVLSLGTGWEAWDQFPDEAERLIGLIGSAPNTVLISGDVHYGELTRLDREGAAPLWDVTSSGLTETWPNLPPNKRRVSAYKGRSFGLLEIDWTAKQVNAQVRDEEGGVRLSQAIAFG